MKEVFMSHLVIRQSGGANIVSIPKAILKTLELHVGAKLDLSVVNNSLVTVFIDTSWSTAIIKLQLKLLNDSNSVVIHSDSCRHLRQRPLLAGEYFFSGAHL